MTTRRSWRTAWRTATALGADLGDMVFCNQSHGRAVRVVTAADRGRGTLSLADAIDSTDALVTTEPGIALVVMVADCVPIVLHDPTAHVLACVHAGWRGTVARVSEAAVEVMSTLGANPANVIACLGPAIAPDRYQVGADVAEAAQRCFGSRAAEVLPADGTGQWLFDLWAANRIVLRQACAMRTSTWPPSQPAPMAAASSSAIVRHGPAGGSPRSRDFTHGVLSEPGRCLPL